MKLKKNFPIISTFRSKENFNEATKQCNKNLNLTIFGKHFKKLILHGVQFQEGKKGLSE